MLVTSSYQFRAQAPAATIMHPDADGAYPMHSSVGGFCGQRSNIECDFRTSSPSHISISKWRFRCDYLPTGRTSLRILADRIGRGTNIYSYQSKAAAYTETVR